MSTLEALVALLLGTALNAFSSGKWATPLAAWLAPVFLLHFARSQSTAVAVGGVALALFVSVWLANRGVIPVPGLASVAISALIALATLAPYIADRLLAPRISGVAATLVFPLAWAAMEFAASRWSPYGTWGAVAHSQYGNLPLMQLVSVSGVAGIGFLVAWFASVVVSAWSRSAEPLAGQQALLIYAAVWSVVMLGGGARLAFSATPEKSVRVATIGWPEGILAPADWMRTIAPGYANEDRESLRAGFTRINEHFFDATRREAQAGAKIVVWPEANAMTFADDEAALLDRARQLAREQAIDLLIGMAVVHVGSDRRFENKAVLIDPQGQVALSYTKAIPVPGFEARVSRAGKRQLLTHASAHGRVTTAICFDLDFPHFIRQVGQAEADLLLVPASDWEAIKSLHFEAAVFRAIENGVPMVRATRWGLSGVVEPYGRVLAQLDPFIEGARDMVVQLAPGGVRTIYARWGDWFGWTALVVAVSGLGLAWRTVNAENLAGTRTGPAEKLPSANL